MKRGRNLARLTRTLAAYRRRRAIVGHRPLRLWVETSNRCNLQCTVCPQSSDRISPRGEMDFGLYEQLIGQVAGWVSDINLSHRGEPLFHPRLPEMIALAGRHAIGTRLHTNATLLTPEVGRALLDAGLDMISFSFDGYDAAAYGAVRRGACFEETLWNILRFLREKQRRGRRRPYTILQVIEHEAAGPDAPAAFRRAFAGLPLDKLYVKRPHNWAGNVGAAAPAGGPVAAPTHPCTFPWYALTVLYSGEVVPCPQDWYAELALGRMPETSLWSIWNGAPMQALRRRQAALALAGLSPCARCDRVLRPVAAGIPIENLKAFSGELLAGYEWVGKLIRR